MTGNDTADKLVLERPSKDFFRFLVVDDEPVARNLLRTILKSTGYTQVDEADSGLVALEALANFEYHVVLLDKNMPGIDGLEVMRRAQSLKTEVEFIMITAYGSMESAMEAMDLGAFSYVTKPFSDVRVITRRVDAALEKVVIRRENVLLLERLGKVLIDLERAEEELHNIRATSGPQEDQEEVAKIVGQAVKRLRVLAIELNFLRDRSKGAALRVLEKIGEEVVSVAELLGEGGQGQVEGKDAK
jgi:CheY-like chemotaxis protein